MGVLNKYLCLSTSISLEIFISSFEENESTIGITHHMSVTDESYVDETRVWRIKS